MSFEKNIELDAALVKAAAEGGLAKFMFAARSLGLKPSEATRRSKWLKKQPSPYVRAVCEKVIELGLAVDESED